MQNFEIRVPMKVFLVLRQKEKFFKLSDCVKCLLHAFYNPKDFIKLFQFFLIFPFELLMHQFISEGMTWALLDNVCCRILFSEKETKYIRAIIIREKKRYRRYERTMFVRKLSDIVGDTTSMLTPLDLYRNVFRLEKAKNLKYSSTVVVEYQQASYLCKSITKFEKH